MARLTLALLPSMMGLGSLQAVSAPSFVAMITCNSVRVTKGLGVKEYIKIEEHPRQLQNSYIYNLAVYVRDDNKGNGHLKT
jgi:hypothetical protein